ncbi:MAG: hypothetical protein GXZ08_09510 [Tissierellia bacterium]|nr:hypothetical protein [Tissierellia bacterium]
MNKIRDTIARFMYGRYGVDELNNFLMVLALVLNFVGLFNRGNRGGSILSSISLFLFVFLIFRMFSKDVGKRSAENRKFLDSTKPLRNRLFVFKMQWKDRKTHRYVKCENCGTYNRVPKNLGKIKIRCNRCKHEFIKRV